MSGNTGKMTSEALEQRGPRMVLWSVYRLIDYHFSFVGFVIGREKDARPIQDAFYSHKTLRRHATSYDIRYLLRISRARSYRSDPSCQ